MDISVKKQCLKSTSPEKTSLFKKQVDKVFMYSGLKVMVLTIRKNHETCIWHRDFHKIKAFPGFSATFWSENLALGKAIWIRWPFDACITQSNFGQLLEDFCLTGIPLRAFCAETQCGGALHLQHTPFRHSSAKGFVSLRWHAVNSLERSLAGFTQQRVWHDVYGRDKSCRSGQSRLWHSFELYPRSA